VVTEVRRGSFGLVTERRHDIGVLCAVSHSFAYWNARHIVHRRVWYRALSLRVFDVRASSSSMGYPCAKFRFCGDLQCWASPWRKIAYSINQSLSHSQSHSLNQLIWCTEAFASDNIAYMRTIDKLSLIYFYSLILAYCTLQ